MSRVTPKAGYETLAKIHDEALEQAQSGKGRERHNPGGDLAFIEQPMLQIGRELGPGFKAGQIAKKMAEGIRLQHAHRRRELLGLENYVAGLILFFDENPAGSLEDAHRTAVSTAYSDQLVRQAHEIGGPFVKHGIADRFSENFSEWLSALEYLFLEKNSEIDALKRRLAEVQQLSGIRHADLHEHPEPRRPGSAE